MKKLEETKNVAKNALGNAISFGTINLILSFKSNFPKLFVSELYYFSLNSFI